jgi:tetratricopeptide (TPR) repeat protein
MKIFIPLFLVFNVFILCAQETVESLSEKNMSSLDSLYSNTKNPKDMLPFAQAMLKKGEIELDQNDTSFAKILFKLADVYYFLADFENAENYLKRAIAIQKIKIPESIVYSTSLSRLGVIYLQQFRLDEAEEQLQSAKKIIENAKGKENVSYAGSLANLGMLYFDKQDLIYGKKLLSESVAIFEKIEETKHPFYLNALSNFGILLLESGEFETAEIIYKKTIQLRKDIQGEQHPYYSTALHNLGLVYFYQNIYGKAEKYLSEALVLRRNVLGEGHPAYAHTIESLGNLSMDIGDFANAEKYFLEAEAIKKKYFDEKHPENISILQNLGYFYNRIDHFEKAETNYLKASELYKEVYGEKSVYYARCLANLGTLYFNLKDYDKALNSFSTAADILGASSGDNLFYYIEILGNLGNVCWSMGDLEAAEKYYTKFLDLALEKLPDYDDSRGKAYDNMASLYTHKKEFLKAYELFEAALKFKNSNLVLNFNWMTERERYAYWQKEKNFYADINAYAAAAANEYPKSATLAYNANMTAKSILLESSRILDELAGKSTDTITVKIYEQLKEKRKLINHLISTDFENYDILATYKTQADSLDKLLVNRLSAYSNSKFRLERDWTEVRDALKEAEAAIEFARYFDRKDSTYRYLALLIRPGYQYPRAIKLCSEKELEAIPAGRGFAELEGLVWEPIDSFLNGVKTIYYSPDGLLNNLAFCAFCGQGKEIEVISKEKNVGRGSVEKKSSTVKAVNCNYLSDRYNLHHISTTRYLAEGLSASSIPNSVLVVGGVNYDEMPANSGTEKIKTNIDYLLSQNLSRTAANASRMEYLPGTEAEIQRIEKLLGRQRWQIRSFSGKSASENVLKTELENENPAVLHIATHGFAFPEPEEKKGDGKNRLYRVASDPMIRSGLLLSGANYSWLGNQDTILIKTGDDGILTALEISNMDLKNTKIVVLSACETGLGKIEGSEGTFGLKRGFKLAGVEQIIVSLWSVPDKETMELMNLFYTDLAKTKNAVASFANAQSTMRRRYPERPDLWAGFVLVR